MRGSGLYILNVKAKTNDDHSWVTGWPLKLIRSETVFYGVPKQVTNPNTGPSTCCRALAYQMAPTLGLRMIIEGWLSNTQEGNNWCIYTLKSDNVGHCSSAPSLPPNKWVQKIGETNAVWCICLWAPPRNLSYLTLGLLCEMLDLDGIQICCEPPNQKILVSSKESQCRTVPVERRETCIIYNSQNAHTHTKSGWPHLLCWLPRSHWPEATYPVGLGCQQIGGFGKKGTPR